MFLIQQRIPAATWCVLIIGAVFPGALASDQASQCQAPSQAHEPKAWPDDRTSFMQTATVVQKRGLAVAPPQTPQAAAMTLFDRKKENAKAVVNQEAAHHVSVHSDRHAAAKPVEPLLIKPDAPPPLWCVRVGQVFFCAGVALLVLFALLACCGKVNSLLPTPQYVTDQQKQDIKKDRLFYVSMLSFGALAMMVTDQFLPSLTKMQVDFGTTPQVMAFTLQINWFLISFSALVMAALGDIVGRKTMMVLCAALKAAASFGCASAPSVEWFIAGCALQGISSGAIAIIMMIFRDLFEDKDERMNYIAGTFGLLILCPSIAPALGGFVAHYTSWRVPFIFFGVWAFVNTVLLARFQPETRSAPTGDQTFEEYRLEVLRVLGDRHIMVLGICQGLCTCLLFSVDTNFSQVLGVIFNQNQAEISWKLAINTGCILVPLIVVEIFSESVGACKLLQTAFGVALIPCVASFIVGSTCSSWPPLMICVLLSQLPIVAAYTACNSLYFETVGEASGAAAGINKFVEMFIASIGSAIASMIVKNLENAVRALLFWIGGLALALVFIFFVGFGFNPPSWALKQNILKEGEDPPGWFLRQETPKAGTADVRSNGDTPIEDRPNKLVRMLPSLKSLACGTACPGKWFKSPCA